MGSRAGQFFKVHFSEASAASFTSCIFPPNLDGAQSLKILENWGCCQVQVHLHWSCKEKANDSGFIVFTPHDYTLTSELCLTADQFHLI